MTLKKCRERFFSLEDPGQHFKLHPEGWETWVRFLSLPPPRTPISNSCRGAEPSVLSQKDKQERNDTFPALSSREFLWFVFLFCFEDSLKRQEIILVISQSAACIYFCDLIGYPPLLYLLVTHRFFKKPFFLVTKVYLVYLSTTT